MATRISSLCRLNGGMANLLLRNTIINGARTLYTEQNLGVDNYERVRSTFRNQFTNVDGLFRKKMEDVCSDETSMVFTEDLKAMLHLAQKRPEDMELLHKMITKFNAQSKEMRFGTYVFGPVVMRAFYFLDEPDIALAAFNNPELENFFNQFTSYKVLLTLLYRHGRYDDMKNVYNVIREKMKQGLGGPRQSLVLIMAACYKQNTKEAYDYALNIWNDFSTQTNTVPLRAVYLLSCLSINQNAPHVAVEILSVVKEQRLSPTKNMKVHAYTKLNRLNEIIPIFRHSLETYQEFKDEYFKDVIMNLEELLENNDTNEAEELRKLLQQLHSANMINNNTTIDDYVNQPLTGLIKRNMDNSGYNQNFQNVRYNQNYQNNAYNQNYQNIGYNQNYQNPGYNQNYQNPGYNQNYQNTGYAPNYQNPGYPQNYQNPRYNQNYQNNMGRRRRGPQDNTVGLRDML